MFPFKPITEVIYKIGLEQFIILAKICSVLVSALFFLRILMAMITFAPASAYSDALRDTLKYFGIIALYPMLTRLILDFSEGVAARLYYTPIPMTQNKFQEFLAHMFFETKVLPILGNVIDLVGYSIAEVVYSILLVLIIAIGPVIILCSTVVRISIGLSAYFSMFVALCSWPILWNAMGGVAKGLWPYMMTKPMVGIFYWIIIFIFQFLSPIASFFIFYNGSSVAGSNKVSATVVKIIKMGR